MVWVFSCSSSLLYVSSWSNCLCVLVYCLLSHAFLCKLKLPLSNECSFTIPEGENEFLPVFILETGWASFRFNFILYFPARERPFAAMGHRNSNVGSCSVPSALYDVGDYLTVKSVLYRNSMFCSQNQIVFHFLSWHGTRKLINFGRDWITIDY